MKNVLLKSIPIISVIIVFAVIGSLLDGFTALYTMKAIDAVMQKNKDLFISFVTFLVLFSVCMIPSTILLALVQGIYKKQINSNYKKWYVHNLFKKNINEFQSENNAKYISALTNDCNNIETNFIEPIYISIISLSNFIVTIFIMGSVNSIALLIGIGIGIIIAVLSIITNKPIQKHQVQRSALFDNYTSYIKEIFSAFQIIKANNLTEKVKKDYYSKSKIIQQKGYIMDAINTLIFSIQNLTIRAFFIVLICICVYMALNSIITLGGVILIITQIEKILMPLTTLGESMPKIFGTKKIFEKHNFSLVNNNTYNENVSIDDINTSIKFNNVSFNFGEVEILKDINISFEKGRKYLVTGPSGSGKSTLLRLLRKYYIPKTGTILLDETDFKDITKDSYFNQIANVEQQIFLFDDTIKNNLTLYKEYSLYQIEEAIHKAGLSSFIKELPDGINTKIFDNGKNISGGEKSRIAIARALLSNAKIIFLDEIFSSLDIDSAKNIEKTLLGLNGITVINVSHVFFEDTQNLYSEKIVLKNKKIHTA